MILPAIGGTWAAIRWYLLFRENALAKQRAHETSMEERKRDHDEKMAERFEAMEDRFLTTLGTLQRECMERDAHQRDLRLEDQKRHIDMLHEVAMKMRTSSGSIKAPPPTSG